MIDRPPIGRLLMIAGLLVASQSLSAASSRVSSVLLACSLIASRMHDGSGHVSVGRVYCSGPRLANQWRGAHKHWRAPHRARTRRLVRSARFSRASSLRLGRRWPQRTTRSLEARAARSFTCSDPVSALAASPSPFSSRPRRVVAQDVRPPLRARH